MLVHNAQSHNLIREIDKEVVPMIANKKSSGTDDAKRQARVLI